MALSVLCVVASLLRCIPHIRYTQKSFNALLPELSETRGFRRRNWRLRFNHIIRKLRNLRDIGSGNNTHCPAQPRILKTQLTTIKSWLFPLIFFLNSSRILHFHCYQPASHHHPSETSSYLLEDSSQPILVYKLNAFPAALLKHRSVNSHYPCNEDNICTQITRSTEVRKPPPLQL